MTKKYDISKKSDMRKFGRDLEKSILGAARQSIEKGTYTVNCPHCHKSFKAKSGRNTCPHCRKTVDLQLNINF